MGWVAAILIVLFIAFLLAWYDDLTMPRPPRKKDDDKK